MGSLAGAAYLLHDNAGVLRQAQRDQKSLVAHKGKGFRLILEIQYFSRLWKEGQRSFDYEMKIFMPEVSEKLPQG
jgi:hypothetical protein